ncbi:phage tail protein [Ancylobacter sp. G4_0304]|uniref:phage tail protein n=1 Tax=Ancylobacter sp. G4_0304 TaxID=3114289 RepID=UPI0039C5B73C
MTRDAGALLPTSASLYERTLARAIDPSDELGPVIDAMHGLKINNPPASFLPYIVWEYGLGMLTPFVTNVYELIEAGVDWERERGTPTAADRALGWLGYTATYEYAPPRRRWWNMVQLELDRLPDDEADLPRVNGLMDLSIPFRSDFWRGYHGYDVRAAEAGYSPASACLASDDSGIRVTGGKAKWSFGREVEITHDVTAEDLARLGIDDPYAITIDGEPLFIGEDVFRAFGGRRQWRGKWTALPWRAPATYAASVLMAQSAGTGPAWAVFLDDGGEVLFCRRCRVRRIVTPAIDGPYACAGGRYAPGVGVHLYLEALTDFDEAPGTVATSVGFILSAEPLAGHPRGAAHLPPDGLADTSALIAETPIHIEFGRTVRERVACLLRF